MTRPPGPAALPYAAIETLFLDVGNTLVSMDFDRIARELAARGVACDAAELRRAEAAGRPQLSSRVARGASTESADSFARQIRGLLGRLRALAQAEAAQLDALTAGLVPALREAHRAHRLWCAVLPGVPETLRALGAAGLRLVAVSNSDGSVEGLLERTGLRGQLERVLDSHCIGFEKPDPRIFERALELSGARRERTLHAGDLFDVDVAGARAAGLHGVLLDPFGDWQGVAGMDCERAPDLAALGARLLAARSAW